MDKTLLCISQHGLMLGGGEHSFVNLIEHLHHRWKIVALLPEKGELEVRIKNAKIKTRILSLSKVRPWKIHKIIISLINLYELCRELQPVLIYANGSRAALYAGILKLLYKVPVVWHCRVMEKDPLLDSILIRLSNIVIVNSQATAKRFKTNFREKIKVIYNGFDLEWLKDPNVKKASIVKDKWISILVSARVSKTKRHDIALTAFETVAEKFPDTHLILMGAKDPLELEWWNYLQDITNNSKFSKRIHWIGYQHDVRPWYKAAKLLVLTSEFEGFGRVLIEAMAMGVPVIANRVGGIPEIITDGTNGLLMNNCDPKSTSESISKILNDNNLSERLSAQAKRRAMQFDMNLHVEKMSEIFDSFKSFAE